MTEQAQTPESPETQQEGKRPGLIRRLYNWVLGWADRPGGTVALVLLAIAESSFFPVPPDVLLLALSLGKPKKSFRFALWCTLGSVLGGVIGYAIGWGLWSAVDDWVFEYVFSEEKFGEVMEIYNEYGAVFVFGAAFTPIPYKVFTIAAGVAQLNLPIFIAASVVGRGARFFLVAGFVRIFGDKAKEIIDKYFNLVTIGGTVLLIGGLALIKLL